MTTATTPAPPVDSSPRGVVGCRCPMCGEPDSLRLRVFDGVYECGSCDNEVTAADLLAQVQHYTHMLALLAFLPVLPE